MILEFRRIDVDFLGPAETRDKKVERPQKTHMHKDIKMQTIFRIFPGISKQGRDKSLSFGADHDRCEHRNTEDDDVFDDRLSIVDEIRQVKIGHHHSF